MDHRQTPVTSLRKDHIYHILSDTEPVPYQPGTAFKPSTLPATGFLHCCTAEQLVRVASRFFGQCGRLEVLEITPARLTPKVRFRDLYGEGIVYPHVFGPINPDAVRRVIVLMRDGFSCHLYELGN